MVEMPVEKKRALVTCAARKFGSEARAKQVLRFVKHLLMNDRIQCDGIASLKAQLGANDVVNIGGIEHDINKL